MVGAVVIAIGVGDATWPTLDDAGLVFPARTGDDGEAGTGLSKPILDSGSVLGSPEPLQGFLNPWARSGHGAQRRTTPLLAG